MGVDTTQFVLNAIDTVTQFGIKRQRFKMLYDPGYSMYWIKGIGSDIYPFYFLACLDDGYEDDLTLSCYDSLGVRLYTSATCFSNSIFTPPDTTSQSHNLNNKFMLFRILFPI